MQSLIFSRCLRSFESIHLCCIITDEGFVFTKQKKAKEKEKKEKKKKEEERIPKFISVSTAISLGPHVKARGICHVVPHM